MPPNRQLAMVKNAATPSCAVGWAITPERAHFAKFTRPIYRDHGWVALAVPDEIIERLNRAISFR